MSAPEVTLVDKTVTLAATVATDIFNLSLAQYERVTIAMQAGAADVTAAVWGEGAGSLFADNAAVAAAVLDSLDAGETAVVKLAGEDIPSQIKVTLTSLSGSTVAVVVKGVLKGAAIIPE